MLNRKTILTMTTAAAICAAPVLAFGQADVGGSSSSAQTTQTTPNNDPAGSAPGSRGSAQAPANTRDTSPGAPTGSMPSSRGSEQTSANAPDGTPGNPPGTAAGRALDRTLGTNMSGSNPSGENAGDRDNAANRGTGSRDMSTGATTGTTAVDSVSLANGRRASQVIGSNVYNENNDSIGEVQDIVIPNAGGQPVAVISVGGFLGIGSRLVAVPYERLQHNAERNRWMLPGATKESLQSMPAFNFEGNRRG